MLLNHLPISFSSQTFSGYLIPYTDADQLRALRQELRATHFCLRVGEQIAQFPYPTAGNSKGTPHTFDITEDHAVANALARNALLRSFFNNSRPISGVRPVRFVNTTKNLLSGPESDTFCVLPEYSFDVRPLAPQDGALINGVVINFGARLLVRPTAATLQQRGASLVGLYLMADDEADDPYILPMFDRKLAGRVVRVEDGFAILDDCRVDRIALDAAWVEPSTATFERLGGQLLGNRYKAFQHELQTCISKISGAEQQLARLKKMFEFKDIQGDLVACEGLTIQLDGHLTEVRPGMAVGMSRRFQPPQCSLRPGGSITVPWPVDPQIETNGPFDCDSFERKRVTIGFIFPAEHSGHVEQFGATLRTACRQTESDSPFPKACCESSVFNRLTSPGRQSSLQAIAGQARTRKPRWKPPARV